MHDVHACLPCRRKLAGLIAYIPLPVVAGYLGYVGYFCLAAGAAQSSGKPVSSLPSWTLLLEPDAWTRTAAGFASFAFIYATLRNWRHPLCMPTVLCLVRPPPWPQPWGRSAWRRRRRWPHLMPSLACNDPYCAPPSLPRASSTRLACYHTRRMHSFD